MLARLAWSELSADTERSDVKDSRELKVWEKGHQLAPAIYKATEKFLKDKLYGLTGQIRRSCVSIPANISEGCGRNGDAELARFLQIPMGSASELECHLLLSRNLGLLDTAIHEQLTQATTEIKRMLTSLIQTLKASRQQLAAES